MKRLLMNNFIELNIEVAFGLKDAPLVATEVLPLGVDEIDPQALADYHAFVDLLAAMIDYYGFEIVHSHPSKTSFYYMFARKEAIAKDDVPYYVYLRVSDHLETHKSAEHLQKIRDNLNQLLEEHKRPATKKRQRYQPLEIIVNDELYTTYEEAAQAAECILRNWMTQRGIDISPYDQMWTDV